MPRYVLCRAVAAALLLTALPSAPASAHGCGSNVIVFGVTPNEVEPLYMPNSSAAVCLAGDPADAAGYDSRIIDPLATHVVVRYLPDDNLGPRVDAAVEGFGLDGQFTLRRRNSMIFGTTDVYDSEPIPIALDAAGCITATVVAPDGATVDSNTFHRLDAMNVAPCET